MALFDRNDNRGYGYRGDPNANRGGGFLDRVQNAFRGQDVHRGSEYGAGGGMSRGWNAGQGGYGRPMDREGGLHQRNSWSDGAWTADAGERSDREWNLSNRGRTGYDRDMNDSTPTQAGWRAGSQGRSHRHLSLSCRVGLRHPQRLPQGCDALMGRHAGADGAVVTVDGTAAIAHDRTARRVGDDRAIRGDTVLEWHCGFCHMFGFRHAGSPQ